MATIWQWQGDSASGTGYVALYDSSGSPLLTVGNPGFVQITSGSATIGVISGSVTLTGSTVTRIEGTHDQTANVTAAGGAETITVNATAGTLAELLHYGAEVPPIAGTGNHTLEIFLAGTLGFRRLIELTSACADTLRVTKGIVIYPDSPTTMRPSDRAAQATLSQNIYLDGSLLSLVFKYTNDSGAIQTGTRYYRTLRLERPVT